MNNQNIHEEIAFELEKISGYLKDLKLENERLKSRLESSEYFENYWMKSSEYWSARFFEVEKKAQENDESNVYKLMRA